MVGERGQENMTGTRRMNENEVRGEENTSAGANAASMSSGVEEPLRVTALKVAGNIQNSETRWAIW